MSIISYDEQRNRKGGHFIIYIKTYEKKLSFHYSNCTCFNNVECTMFTEIKTLRKQVSLTFRKTMHARVVKVNIDFVTFILFSYG